MYQFFVFFLMVCHKGYIMIGFSNECHGRHPSIHSVKKKCCMYCGACVRSRPMHASLTRPLSILHVHGRQDRCSEAAVYRW